MYLIYGLVCLYFGGVAAGEASGGCLTVTIFRNCAERSNEEELPLKSIVKVSSSLENTIVEYGINSGETARSYDFCPPGADTYIVSGGGPNKQVSKCRTYYYQFPYQLLYHPLQPLISSSGASLCRLAPCWAVTPLHSTLTTARDQSGGCCLLRMLSPHSRYANISPRTLTGYLILPSGPCKRFRTTAVWTSCSILAVTPMTPGVCTPSR